MRNLVAVILALSLAGHVAAENQSVAWTGGVGVSTGLNRFDLEGLTGLMVTLPQDFPTKSTRVLFQSEWQKPAGIVNYSLQANYSVEPLVDQSRWHVELASLVGLTTPRSWWHASMAIGLGLMAGMDYGTRPTVDELGDPVYASRYVASISLPMEVEAAIFPFDHLGVGFKFLGSLNGMYTNTGFETFVSIR